MGVWKLLCVWHVKNILLQKLLFIRFNLWNFPDILHQFCPKELFEMAFKQGFSAVDGEN